MLPQNAMIGMFRNAGFVLIRDKGHMIWGCPCGHARVVTRSTPARGRGDKNAKAEMTRTLRACAAQTLRQEIA